MAPVTYTNRYDNPNEWLWGLCAMGRSGRQWIVDFDFLSPRRHDWPSNNSGALGQECCDSCIITQPAAAPVSGVCAMQRLTFSPWGPTRPNSGDGGDINVVTSDGWLKIIATQDGGHPGLLYYFVGPGVGQPDDGRVGGWVLGRAVDRWDAWNSTVTWLQQSPGTPWQPLGQPTPSFTRWLVNTFIVPAMDAGVPNSGINANVLVSEHYGTQDPTSSPQMERFFYGYGWGMLRWEYWSTSDPIIPGAIDRAPNTPYGYPTSIPLNPNMRLTDARTYTNFVVGSPIQCWPDGGWPIGLQLP